MIVIIRRQLRIIGLVIAAILMLVNGSVTAISKADLKSILEGTPYYDPGATLCSSAGTTPPSSPTTGVAAGKVFVIGDSLTYGSVKSGDLLAKLNDAGLTTDTNYKTIDKPKSGLLARVQGASVDATGGISIRGTNDWIDSDKAGLAQSDIVLIALGTNARSEARAAGKPTDDKSVAEVQSKSIDDLVKSIRDIQAASSEKKTAKIIWINTFFQDTAYGNYQIINDTIASASLRNNFSVMDLAVAAQTDTKLTPDGGDKVHYSPDGYKYRSEYIASHINSVGGGVPTAGAISTSSSTAPSCVCGGAYTGDDSLLSLTFPAFPNEDSIASGIEAAVRFRSPKSPWLAIPDLGHFIINESRKSNVNPLLIVSTGGVESSYGVSGAGVINHNAFGWEKGEKYFPSWANGITQFTIFMRAALDGKHHANYAKARSIYEYISVHQAGGIYYKPNNKEINGAGPDFPIRDNKMGVDVSWESPYNPVNYYKGFVSIVRKITNITFPDVPTQPGGAAAAGGSGGCTSTTGGSTGNASQYIKDCSANNGNALIACVAINQLMGYRYDSSPRPAPNNPNPQILECSSLVNMAIYRAFGYNDGGICSVAFLNNKAFEKIQDIRTIQPGDMVGKGTECTGSGGTGHIAIVVSYDPASKKLITVEASSHKYLSGLRGIGGPGGYNVGLEVDGRGTYEWAVRYIGPKNIQPGALK